MNAHNVFRYERKFLVKDLHRYSLDKIINLNTMNFNTIYPPRKVNNIYFDSIQMKCFHDNVEGIANREKVRIRWYGNRYGHIKKPILEIKIRKNSVGTKEFYPLLPFELKKSTTSNCIKNIIIKSEIPEITKQRVLALNPKLLNGYLRKYYTSFDKRFRITLDNDLFYAKTRAMNILTNETFFDQKSTVVEIKYDVKDDLDIDTITRQFNFRMTKNSKYVTGIYALYY